MKEIHFILDETGSMQSIAEDAVGSYNQFIEEQREVVEESGNDAVFSLYLFSRVIGEPIRTRYEEKEIDDIEKLDNYRPRGMTPLLDAIGTVVEGASPDNGAMVVIMTDGLENASTDYTRDQVKSLIEERKEEGWEFVFLGANMDAVQVGQSMGVPQGTSKGYDATPVGTRTAMSYASGQVSSYISDEDEEE